MYSYFHKTKLDETFSDQNLRSRLPAKIVDSHANFNLPEHVAAITEEAISGDWALESGLLMTYEDARHYVCINWRSCRQERGYPSIGRYNLGHHGHR